MLQPDPKDWNDLARLTRDPQSVHSGERRGTRERLVDAMRAHPDRLLLQTNALVERILLEPGGGRNRKGHGVQLVCRLTCTPRTLRRYRRPRPPRRSRAAEASAVPAPAGKAPPAPHAGSTDGSRLEPFHVSSAYARGDHAVETAAPVSRWWPRHPDQRTSAPESEYHVFPVWSWFSPVLVVVASVGSLAGNVWSSSTCVEGRKVPWVVATSGCLTSCCAVPAGTTGIGSVTRWSKVPLDGRR